MTSFLNEGAKRAALINDLSCFGKCSLTVAIPVVSGFGAEAVPLPTAVLSTHTGGFEGFTCLDMTAEMEKIIAHWKSLSLKFDCIYTGYFCSKEQIKIAARFIEDFKTPETIVIVDPVMGDNGKLYRGFNTNFVKEMATLCKMADIITPNVTEAEFLTGIKASDDCQEILNSFQNDNIIITGVRTAEEIGYRVKTSFGKYSINHPFLGQMLHGCGDVFASALCGKILCGADVDSAIKSAADFCNECVAETVKTGKEKQYGLEFEKVLTREKKW